MDYDRAKWHHGGDYPTDLPPENAATHIGIYLGWAIKRDLAGGLLSTESQDALDAVRNGELSGRDLLLTECDETLSDEFLSDTGIEFTVAYYETRYFTDYAACLDSEDAPTVYHIRNSPENWALVEALLDRRLAEWRNPQSESTATSTRSMARPRPARTKKPWWRLW